MDDTPLTDRLSPFDEIPSKRGKLYVFEGLDRAGKTTQVSKLTEIKKMRFPSARMSSSSSSHVENDPNVIGRVLSEILEGNQAGEVNGRVLHLLFSADRWNKQQEIEDTLANGVDVAIDRYSYSGVAYTIARHIQSRETAIETTDSVDLESDLSECAHLTKWAIASEQGLPKPDVVFFFDADPEVLAKRSDYGRGDIHEKIPFQKCIRSVYHLLFNLSQDDGCQSAGGDLIFGPDTQIVVIDAQSSVDDIQKKIASVLRV